MDELIVFSVLEITQHLKQVIETQIESLYVRGEISNFTRHSSGHIYFNLKDPNATLRCTFFRFANLHLDFEPEEGMEVICFGKLTVYEKGGSYSLNVQTMLLSGQGDLARKFEQLKVKLEAEGLFEQKHKQQLPRYPGRIGIVTSPTGAALQDILNILGRRFPLEVQVFPALVQGAEAPGQLIAGIEQFNAEGEVDLIILTRGGGSQEDLFCFNDEGLARAIFASRLPIISAVGHEIDFTIADFVADLRAPTPSAAAEIAVPDRKDLLAYLATLGQRMKLAAGSRHSSCGKKLGDAIGVFHRLHPERIWQGLQLRVDMAALDLAKARTGMQVALHRYTLRRANALHKLHNAAKMALQSRAHCLREHAQTLQYAAQTGFTGIHNRVDKLGIQVSSRSPFKLLEQGYSMLFRDSEVISSLSQLQSGDKVRIRLKDGAADALITGKDDSVGHP